MAPTLCNVEYWKFVYKWASCVIAFNVVLALCAAEYIYVSTPRFVCDSNMVAKHWVFLCAAAWAGLVCFFVSIATYESETTIKSCLVEAIVAILVYSDVFVKTQQVENCDTGFVMLFVFIAVNGFVHAIICIALALAMYMNMNNANATKDEHDLESPLVEHFI